jgi:hypothetical protein
MKSRALDYGQGQFQPQFELPGGITKARYQVAQQCYQIWTGKSIEPLFGQLKIP